MMAMVRGREMVTVVPAPGVERTRRLPFISSTARFTASMPTPRPEMSETVARRAEPGEEDEAEDLLRAGRGRLFGADQAFLQGLA